MSLLSKPETLDRLVINRTALGADIDAFARDVRDGLSSRPKMLPPKYFYDNLGSHLFEAICWLPEYYVTRAEAEIIIRDADEITSQMAESTKGSVRLIELGSGSAEKTRHLIEAIFRRKKELLYVPVDISVSALERSAERLLHDFSGLRIIAYATDYDTALGSLAAGPNTEDQVATRNVVLFLGSSIGNLDPDASRALLRKIRSALHQDDLLFIGADLKKSPDILIPAYDDALGVTAAFNLNVLVRMNSELGADFDLAKFHHRAIYNQRASRIEMHLYSREPQTVRIKATDMTVEFEQGESIHTENSYKFDMDQLSLLGIDTGFDLRKTWYDDGHRFSLNMFACV
jgi:L-histidine N-alpha-methyltransferase